MDIASYLKTKSKQIEKHLGTLVPEKDIAYKQLFSAARYSLLSGGKRLRPILTLATAETLGDTSNKALNPACAIEMIHTYSLIHDDLPCMDNDDFRRGKLTLHKVFTEGHAVLAGDYLLTFAFEVIAKDKMLLPEQKVALIALLAKNSGGEGMIGGQVMDIEAEGIPIDIERLQLIHRHKTGAMITAAIEFGGIIAGASPKKIEALRHFGDDLGLAFQVIDDVIDVTASEQKHGKTVASDALNNKTTYVTLLGLETAQKIASDLLERAKGHLASLECNTQLLQSLADRLVHRNL